MGHVPTTSWVTWHFCWLAGDWVKREGHRVMGKGLNCSLVPKHEDCVLDIRIRKELELKRSGEDEKEKAANRRYNRDLNAPIGIFAFTAPLTALLLFSPSFS